MQAPRVSVVLSAYNAKPYIQESIRSILAQTYTLFEFLIIDDGSTDGTGDLLEEMQKRDSRIRIFRQEHNGLTVSLNRGIRETRAEYIARMDADDIASNDRLEKQVTYMDTHPQVAVCGSQGWLIDGSGRRIGKKNFPLAYQDIRKRLLFNNQFIHSSLCIRASVLNAVGLYDELFKTSQDYELMLRIAATYPVANLPDRLVGWRVRQHSISWKNKRQEWDALRARWRGVTMYHYPFFVGFFHIMARLMWILVPQGLKRQRYER